MRLIDTIGISDIALYPQQYHIEQIDIFTHIHSNKIRVIHPINDTSLICQYLNVFQSIVFMAVMLTNPVFDEVLAIWFPFVEQREIWMSKSQCLNIFEEKVLNKVSKLIQNYKSCASFQRFDILLYKEEQFQMEKDLIQLIKIEKCPFLRFGLDIVSQRGISSSNTDHWIGSLQLLPKNLVAMDRHTQNDMFAEDSLFQDSLKRQAFWKMDPCSPESYPQLSPPSVSSHMEPMMLDKEEEAESNQTFEEEDVSNKLVVSTKAGNYEGCRCKKNKCGDRYCGCHKAGRRCGSKCVCKECSNHGYKKHMKILIQDLWMNPFKHVQPKTAFK